MPNHLLQNRLFLTALIASLITTSVRANVGDELLKLTSADAAIGDQFGYSVAVRGKVAIIGSPYDNDNGDSSGSAHLFDVITGQELFELTATDAAASDWFGLSVAIDGNRAIVGSPNDGATSPFVSGPGSAYLFDVATGQELFKLVASAAANSKFGNSAAISGNLAIVGSPYDDHEGDYTGSAYLFDVATGQELFKLTASDAAPLRQFGGSVAISGNVAIVGAQEGFIPGTDPGSAYLFNATTGQELFKLTASDGAAEDQFGVSVAISGNVAIVGALRDDDAGLNSGSAYLFDVTTGQELFKLTASDGAAHDLFGASVAISGNVAVVGSSSDADAGIGSGSAYVFDVTTGSQLAKLTASDAAANDAFGFSVAISGNAAVIGASYDDNYTGSAYVFSVVPEPESLVLLALGLLVIVCRDSRRIRSVGVLGGGFVLAVATPARTLADSNQ